jgi:hypothetical protein
MKGFQQLHGGIRKVQDITQSLPYCVLLVLAISIWFYVSLFASSDWQWLAPEHGTLKLLSILGAGPLDFGRDNMAGDIERIFEKSVGDGPRKRSFLVVEKNAANKLQRNITRA